MFVWPNGDELWLTPQTDHMDLVGAIGAAWGRNAIEPPRNRLSAVLAARMHDEGWREWELCPEVDASTGLPVEFRRVSRERHVRFYGRGADFAERVDAYAALLVSLHGTGLYLGRYGVDGETVPDRADLTPTACAYVEAEDRRQQALWDQLGGERAQVWHDYRLLQAWDRLGIFLCDGMQQWVIGPVPAAGACDDPRIALRRLDDRTASVDPFPFAGDAADFALFTYRLPSRRFFSDEELRDYLTSAQRSEVVVRLVAPRP